MIPTSLKINTNTEEYVIPSVEGCLADTARKFYSTQNAVLVHEWLRGTSVNPLVLEAVKPKDPKLGVYETFELGKLHISAYAEPVSPGQILDHERYLAALPLIDKTMKENIAFYEENPSETLLESLSTSTDNMMQVLSKLWALNASCMFLGSAMPPRFVLETMETLNILFTCVLTQRNKVIYATELQCDADLPENLYNNLELDRVLGHLHVAGRDQFFPNPEIESGFLGLADTSFYKQCAMAYSATAGVPIPRDYIEEQPTRVYFWAGQQLTKFARMVSSFEIRPKQSVVLSFPFQKR